MTDSSPARTTLDAPRALDALVDLLALDRLPRTGWILAGVAAPESVAGHCLGTAHVALALLPSVSPALDAARTLAMALLHDAPEAGSGDLPRGAARHLPAGAKHAMEDALARELLGPLGPLAADAWEEYRARETREARFVALCDGLQMGVRALGYARAGWPGWRAFHGSFAALDAAEFPPVATLLRTVLAQLEAAG